MNVLHLVNAQNPQSEYLVNLLGVSLFAVERFRDAGVDKDKSLLWIMTKTGGILKSMYPNQILTDSPYYLDTEELPSDSSIAIHYFKLPPNSDISNLQEKKVPNIEEKISSLVASFIRGEDTEANILIREELEKHIKIMK